MTLEEAMECYRGLNAAGRSRLYLVVAAHGPSADGYCAACAKAGIRQVCPCPVYEGWVRAISLVRHEESGHLLPERDPRSGWGSSW